MTNHEISAVFDQIADLLEFQGANPFRVRAYRNAARTVHDLPESVAEIAADAEQSLEQFDGIGKELAEKIVTLVETGSLPFLEELLADVPESVLAILRVPGLGPKKAAALYRELNIATLDQLRNACREHKVRELKGFGEKTEEAILKGIDIADEANRRILWIEADGRVQEILDHMESLVAQPPSAVDNKQKAPSPNEPFNRRQPRAAVPQVCSIISPAGSYRRGKETVGDLDFLVVASDVETAMDHLAAYQEVGSIIARGKTKMSLRLRSGLQVDLRAVAEESFGAALQYFTGSKDHNVALRGRAKSQGLKINEYGVFRGEKSIAGRTEEEVYGSLGLPCFPPELREARREFDWADAGRLPELIELSDVQGDLHMHSTWTDGHATIEEMARAAKQRGLKYIAITDHSKRVSMVGGLDGKKLRRQWAEIDDINSRLHGITVLKGVEVDILERGGLDLPDDVLAEADWVVASVHYGQRQSGEQITRRVIGALENPHVSAIGHPTGRMLLQREAYDIDLEAVMKAARDNGKFMELNAHPVRLDLNDVGCAMAKAHGVPVVISTDAHSPEGLDVMRCGIQQARRGGLTASDVANTRTWARMKKLLNKVQ